MLTRILASPKFAKLKFDKTIAVLVAVPLRNNAVPRRVGIKRKGLDPGVTIGAPEVRIA